MKVNVERGKGFRGALDYALGKDDGNACEIIGGNMIGTNARELAAEFGLSREARPNIKTPVWHVSLRLPKGDNLDSDKWVDIADDFVQEMGLEGHQYVVIRHHEPDGDHIHIIASRISLDGQIYYGRYDAIRAINLTQDLEERYKLTRTKGLDRARPTPRKAPSRNEIEQASRTGEASPRLILQEIVDAATAESGSVFDFLDRIDAAGAVAHPNVAKTGRMNGFAFEYAGIKFKGSDLGKAYTWKGLQERGIEYEQDRDGEALRDRASGTLSRASQIDGGSPDVIDPEAGPASGGSDPANRRADDRRTRDSGWNERDREEGIGVDPVGDAGGPEISVTDHLNADPRGIISDGGGEGGENDSGTGGEGVPSDRGAGEPSALDRDRRIGSVRPDHWNPVADRVADLAAGTYPAALDDRPGDPVTPAIAAKQKAWDQQHGALQAPEYRLTLMSRTEGLGSFNVGKGRGAAGAEKFYAPDEVRGLIPYLSAQNARGRDIYLTPIDKDHHYIVVDDTTETSLGDLIAAGYRPAMVQESSAGNRQAVLKVPKERDRDEQKAANEVVVNLNRRFGDAAFSGVIHPFRMAGFSNKKPGRNNAFTRIVEAVGGICNRAMEQLDAIRARIVGERTATPNLPDVPRPRVADLPAASSESESAFDRARQQVEGLAAHMGWQRDESRLDYRAAQTMAEDGWPRDEIAAAIITRSPNLVDRHGNPVDYAARTAENVSIESEEEPQREQTPKASDRPEGP